MDASFDIPDSTDWKTTSLPVFEPLEAALRCEVCKEFYSNPVITTCSHTFCSICIRRTIATDGKCPTCKAPCSADKLQPNIVVREIVGRFQEARPKALELARANKEEEANVNGSEIGKKRKLKDTDIEEGEPVRQTRSRQARGCDALGEGTNSTPIEVPDSEDDGDEEFLPDDLVRCPMCNAPMKEAAVFGHLDNCTGEQESGKRATRSRKNNAFPTPLQNQKREPSPPPTRLSGLNYTMMKEGALRKKLGELGIPNWGSKDLMRRRHIEWLNIYNSNCDAEGNRKSTKQLLKDLDVWEKTLGGKADTKENQIMRKDFDGVGHASTHKSQFADLIANARKKKAVQIPKEELGETNQDEKAEVGQEEQRSSPTDRFVEERLGRRRSPSIDRLKPYEDNETALVTIRAKVEQANKTGPTSSSLSREASRASATEEPRPVSEESGIRNPFGSPSRKVPMFSLPEEPIIDVEHSTAVQ